MPYGKSPDSADTGQISGALFPGAIRLHLHEVLACADGGVPAVEDRLQARDGVGAFPGLVFGAIEIETVAEQEKLELARDDLDWIDWLVHQAAPVSSAAGAGAGGMNQAHFCRDWLPTPVMLMTTESISC
jgi:hypothetical protein